MDNTIYRVTTEGDVEGRTTKTLGYCTGNPEDIKAYFNDRKAYEIKLTPITTEHITLQMVVGRQSDLETKRKLEADLNAVNNRLK